MLATCTRQALDITNVQQSHIFVPQLVALQVIDLITNLQKPKLATTPYSVLPPYHTTFY